MSLQQYECPDEIPHWIFEDLQRYIMNLQAPGSFVRACLENNLKNAVLLAGGEEARKAITPVVFFLYLKVPDICWGSPEKVQAWLNSRLH